MTGPEPSPLTDLTDIYHSRVLAGTDMSRDMFVDLLQILGMKKEYAHRYFRAAVRPHRVGEWMDGGGAASRVCCGSGGMSSRSCFMYVRWVWRDEFKGAVSSTRGCFIHADVGYTILSLV